MPGTGLRNFTGLSSLIVRYIFRSQEMQRYFCFIVNIIEIRAWGGAAHACHNGLVKLKLSDPSYLSSCSEPRRVLCDVRRWLWIGALVCVPMASAQTMLDLKSQARNVDFSSAALTKPAKTGTVLPATCSTGEVFFKTDAAPGLNLYACFATNSWTGITGTKGDPGTGFSPACPTCSGAVALSGKTSGMRRITVSDVAGTALDLVIPATDPSAGQVLAFSAPDSNRAAQGYWSNPGSVASLQILPAASKPLCANATRGTIWYSYGTSGVADSIEVCKKAADDSFSWISF